MSKLIEKCVSVELHRQFIHAPLADEQSAYRPNHSTETALLSFISDVRENMSDGCATAVISLDLSAAFDTVDHELLVDRLKSKFGIDGRCLEWFSSYIHDRYQYVKTETGNSMSRRTNHGFPQGSKLGPDLYNSYSSPLPRTATRFGCKVSNFADDTFPYISFNEENANIQIGKLQQTLDGISSWLESNMLKLNPTKTQLIIITKDETSNGKMTELILNKLTIGGHIIQPSASMTFLGVTIDTTLSLKPHIAQITRTSMWQLSEIRRIRRRLDRDTAVTIIRSFIMSRIDYCNAIFHDLPDTTLEPLKRVIHTAARVISESRKFDHISPVLRELHWLPLRQRIRFRVACIVFGGLSGNAPSYLACNISLCDSPRLSSQRLLMVPQKLSNSFAWFGPHVWNNLPSHLRSPELSMASFKTNLKTFLFVKRITNHGLTEETPVH